MRRQLRVTAAVSPSQLAGAINKLLHFRAVVRRGNGLWRIYIRRYRLVREESGTDKGLETEFTIYVEFGPGSTPVLTVKEAEITTRDPQWECMQVSWALSRAGIHVDCKPAPALAPSHYRYSDAPPGLRKRCSCLLGASTES